MITLTQALSFLGVALLLTATPGPDNLMVLSLGLSRGRAPGMAFGLGCALGCLSHTLLAVLGVSALIAASPAAFTALTWAGGAYLVWLGIQALRNGKSGHVEAQRHADIGLARWFSRGLTANAVNPKVVLFFLALLPQFVDPARGHVSLQLGVLGLIFTAQAALLFGLLGYFAGRIGHGLNRHPRAGLWLDRIAGVVFIGLGMRLLGGR